MSRRLEEAVEKCRAAMLPNVPPWDYNKTYYKGMVMGVDQDIGSITPVLRELCDRIEELELVVNSRIEVDEESGQ